MMTKMAVKFAVSALAIGATMVACKPAGSSMRPATASARVPQGEGQAQIFLRQAQAAAAKGDVAAALRFTEQAVEAAPRNPGARLLLGDFYLKNGRFQSAETSFGDVLALDPGNGRAGLSLALARIALGKTGAAIEQLDSMSGSASADDLGLAYALAGQPQRAVEMLEPAARAPGAGARVRQNLALAYALAGDWQKAQAIAAQDVSPAELGNRMRQWASFAQPAAPWTQVASLLGVTPAADEGQPGRLALAAEPPVETAFAAAEPVAPTPVEAAPVEAAPVEAAPAVGEPVRYAAAETEAPAPPVASDWGREPQADPAPAAEEESQPVYAQAIQSLVTPQPSVMRASVKADEAPVIAFPPRRHFTAPAAAPRSGGRFVVQLGAFSSAAGVERAWAKAYRGYGFASHTPLSTTIAIGGRTLHRLSVSGFGSHADASRACQSIKAKGGACFVRTVAGDAPTRWASRYANRPA
jgi:Flp pilus assembly protein TadD